MKAISVRQPYAYGIETGIKTVEVRSWRTDYRGDLLICSSRQWALVPSLDPNELNPALFPQGVSICVVTLKDVVLLTKELLPYAGVDEMPETDRPLYGWLLENPRPVYHVDVRGKLHLFDVDDSLIEYIELKKEKAYEDLIKEQKELQARRSAELAKSS